MEPENREWGDCLRSFQGKTPRLEDGVYLDPRALLVGDVQVGAHSSIWPMAVARGDVHSITIGARTSIQDGSVLHVSHDSPFLPGGAPLVVGDEVTVGHQVTLHGCTVGNGCLIGMGAIVLDRAVLGAGLILGAGALVPGGKTLEGGHLYVGRPARRVRALSEEEQAYLSYSAEHYVRLKNRHQGGEPPHS